MWSRLQVRSAVCDLLKVEPRVRALLAAHREAQHRVADLGAAIAEVSRANGLSYTEGCWDAAPIQDAAFYARHAAAAAPWCAAITALADDPDTKLPTKPQQND